MNAVQPERSHPGSSEPQGGPGGSERNGERLPTRMKIVYGMGDHTINLSLSSLS